MPTCNTNLTVAYPRNLDSTGDRNQDNSRSTPMVGPTPTHVTPLFLRMAPLRGSVRFFSQSPSSHSLSLFLCSSRSESGCRRHGGELSPQELRGSGEVIPDDDEGWPASQCAAAGRTPRRAGHPRGSDGADTGCDLAGELAAHGGAAAQTWATASGGAAVASRQIPRDLVSFFAFLFFLSQFFVFKTICKKNFT